MPRPITLALAIAAALCVGAATAQLGFAAPAESAPSTRIIKGEVATQDPNIAALLWAYTKQGVPSQYVWCTGTVVHERYILTAAHCIDDEKVRNPQRLSVRVQSLNAYKDGQNIKFDKWIFAPSSTPGPVRRGPDVALLRLVEPIKNAKVVKLAEKDPIKGELGRIFGFGMTVPEASGVTSEILRTASVKIDGTSRDYSGGPAIAMLPDSGSASHGDSGGPMFNAAGEQTGISSTAVTSLGAMNYSSVANSRAWILETIAKEEAGNAKP